MPVFKPKGSANWYYQFYIEGNRYYGKTFTASKSEAQNYEATVRAKVIEELKNPNKGQQAITLTMAFDKYYDEVSIHTESAENHLRYMGRLLSLGEHTPLHLITSGEISEWISKRRMMTARNKTTLVAPATVNREVELLSRVIRRAKTVWKFQTPEIDFGPLKLLESAERVRSLSKSEDDKLSEKLREDFRPIVEFAKLTGLRLSNLINLKWSDIHGNELINRNMKSRQDGKVHVLPLTPALVKLLEQQRVNHPEFVFTYVCKKTVVMRGQDQKKGNRYPFTKNGWRKAFKAALKEAGISDFRFHDLRHTAATRILKATGNLKLTSQLLGHSDISTTSRYAHVLKEDVRDGLLKVEAAE